jgi:ATP-dependent protease ClpP protease subunit
MIGDIFIYHGIGREKGEVSAEMFRNELNQNKDAESIKIHFHTPGGDVFEGFNMYNTLMNFKATTGKKVIGIVESVCASIGTLVLGACDEIVMNTASQIMIHNPHVETKGDANKLRGVADHLDKIKHVLIDVFQKKTGLSDEKLWALYDSETWLNASEAKQLGFADDVQDGIKAVAKINLNNFKMETKKEGLWASLTNLFKLTKFRNEFTETLADNRVIIVMSEDDDWTGKQVVLEDGTPLEDGPHTLVSGKTIVVTGGVISEVQATPPPEDNNPDEMDNKIKELEAQLAAALAEKDQAAAQAQALQKEVTTAKAETSKFQNRLSTIEKYFLALKEQASLPVGEQPNLKKGPVIKNANEQPKVDHMGDYALRFYKNRNLVQTDED